MHNKVVIGLWPLSGDFGKTDLSQFEEATNCCIDSGFKTFDVAPNYGGGFAESAIGKIYAGERDIVINTKFGNSINGVKDFTSSALRRSLESSLERLKVQNINTLFLHNPRDEIQDFQSIEHLMDDLKKEGLISYSAISVAKDYPYSHLPNLDSVQFDCNLLYLKELDLYKDRFKKKYVRSPLATGILSGKISRNTTFPSDDQRSEWLIGERLDAIMKRVETLEQIQDDFDLPSLARKFLIQQNDIDFVIFGIRNKHQVEGIVNDLKSDSISQDIMTSIIELERNNFNLTLKDKLGF